MVAITNPAKEMVRFFDVLDSVPRERQITNEILARHFGVDVGTPEWYALIGAVAQRLERLRRLCANVNDSEFSNRMRGRTDAAIVKLTAFANPVNLGANWFDVKPKIVNEDAIGIVDSFSSIARKYKPLRQISDDERVAAIERIETTIEDIDSLEIPDWAKEPLFEGLENLAFRLKHFQFFGHDETLHSLLGLESAVRATVDVANETDKGEERQSYWKAILGALSVAVLVSSAFEVPKNVYETANSYRETIASYVNKQSQMLMIEADEQAGQKLIEDKSDGNQPEEDEARPNVEADDLEEAAQ